MTKKSMKTRYQEWKNRNDLDDASVAILAFLGITFVGTTVWAVKATKDALDEVENQQAWAKEEFAEGNHVFTLYDGSLISIEGPVKIY